MDQIYKIANEQLPMLCRFRVIEQLKYLGVVRIYLEDMGEMKGVLKAGVWGTRDPLLWKLEWQMVEGVFSIGLSMKDVLADWIYTLAHELGHIFCYDRELVGRIHRAYCRQHRLVFPEKINMDTPRDEYHRFFATMELAEEHFCELFASLWVPYGSHKKELRDLLFPLNVSNSKIILQHLLM